MMFKTTYAAMFQNIAPTETLCQQVLSAMQAEEDKKMPTIVPVRRRESHRPVWTLVACAAMVLVAVTLTVSLMKDEKPPVLPVVVTTTVTESTTSATTATTITTAITTTTEAEGILPGSTTGTSFLEMSTTVTPTTSSTTPSTTQTQTTTVLNTPPAPTTTTVPSVLPPVGDYDELFQWIESFTTEPPSKDNTFPTANPTTADTTALPTTTAHTDNDPFPESPTTTKPMAIDPTLPTTVHKGPTTSTTTSKGDPTTNQSNATQPYGGVVSYEGEKTTSDTTQSGDRVLGRLQDNAVLLESLDNAESSCLSATKPPMGNMVVKEFGLYGDRMVILCGSKHTKNTDVTRFFVYDISDPTAPRLLQDFGQNGYYLAAQQADGVLYVASYYVPEGNIRADTPLSFVPRLYRQGKAALLSPDQIVLANNPVCNGYTVLTAISLKGDPKRTSAIALYGQSNRYVSVYDTSILIRSKPYKDKQGKAVSDLVRVTMDAGTIRFTACTTLPE